MAKKPENFEWFGYSDDQRQLLDAVDFYGNNGWDRNGQSDTLMPILLKKCADAGLNIEQVISAMESIGYSQRTTHQLRRWERKRTTGKFGR